MLTGLCVGAAALLLSALLKSLTEGRPFERRNPVQIGCLAAFAIVAGLGSLLPDIAATTVLDRIGLAGTFLPSSTLSWTPIAGAGLLLALALAFHAGSKPPNPAASPTNSRTPS